MTTPFPLGPGVSRRTFVKASALAAAGVGSATAGALMPEARARAGYVAGSQRLRIGLIGCGGRGSGAAVQALHADPENILVSMGDVFPDRLESSLKNIQDEMKTARDGSPSPAPLSQIDVPPERRFTGFDCYKQVIDSGVDVVILTSYPAFRPAHLKYAVEKGKHVFAEKPLAVDAPGMRSVLASADAAKAANLALMVGFCWRYNDGMRATFEKLLSGAIGRVTSVHTTYLTGTLGKRPREAGWSDTEFQMRNWWHFNWISGDHIVEQAVHSIDRLAWAMGDALPQRVICLGGRAARTGPESGNVFDHFAATYEYDSGVRCHHTCRQIDSCPSDNTDYVHATGGSAVIEGWKPVYTLRDTAGAEVWRYTGPNDRNMYQTEHDELFASIRSGKPIHDAHRGANSCMLAIMARMAAYTGQTITWKQAMESTESLVPETLQMGPMDVAPVPVPGKTKFI